MEPKPATEETDMKPPVRAILFDLDGTLLHNDMDEFLPPYFELLTARFAHLFPPEAFMAHLLSATEHMLANDGRRTNEQVFADAFYPAIGRRPEDLEPIFHGFYANDFPKLKAYTRTKPEARRVVQQAFDLGCNVVVATNPVFPALAVEHRLQWAGIADLPFDLVTSFENSCATKPNLLYFEGILETLGHRPEVALVVGDEDMDMVAGNLGCRTFLVPGPRTELGPETPQPTYRGSLADVGRLLQSWKKGK
jgi:FMN phosphatase YigB (HAD superfamily)